MEDTQKKINQSMPLKKKKEKKSTRHKLRQQERKRTKMTHDKQKTSNKMAIARLPYQ